MRRKYLTCCCVVYLSMRDTLRTCSGILYEHDMLHRSN